MSAILRQPQAWSRPSTAYRVQPLNVSQTRVLVGKLYHCTQQLMVDGGQFMTWEPCSPSTTSEPHLRRSRSQFQGTNSTITLHSVLLSGLASEGATTERTRPNLDVRSLSPFSLTRLIHFVALRFSLRLRAPRTQRPGPNWDILMLEDQGEDLVNSVGFVVQRRSSASSGRSSWSHCSMRVVSWRPEFTHASSQSFGVSMLSSLTVVACMKMSSKGSLNLPIGFMIH
ncbi:hypothetical protein V8E55_007540 [Tylopilus felleus]